MDGFLELTNNSTKFLRGNQAHRIPAKQRMRSEESGELQTNITC